MNIHEAAISGMPFCLKPLDILPLLRYIADMTGKAKERKTLSDKGYNGLD